MIMRLYASYLKLNNHNNIFFLYIQQFYKYKKQYLDDKFTCNTSDNIYI